jgi:hypothetical protein
LVKGTINEIKMEHRAWSIEYGFEYSISEAVLVLSVRLGGRSMFPYSSLTIIPYFYTSINKLESKRSHTLLSFFGCPSEKFAVSDGIFEGEDQRF